MRTTHPAEDEAFTELLGESVPEQEMLNSNGANHCTVVLLGAGPLHLLLLFYL